MTKNQQQAIFAYNRLSISESEEVRAKFNREASCQKFIDAELIGNTEMGEPVGLARRFQYFSLDELRYFIDNLDNSTKTHFRNILNELSD